MDIRNSKEIIQNILERYNFTAIYSESCNMFGIETSKNYVDSNDAIDFLYSSAVIGSKSLGIFAELPFFEITKPVRAECLFITQTLPQYICTPVIIVKNAADISDRVVLALKVSVEHKVPVTVVITHDASNNYADFERANNDLGRVSPYISADTFKQTISKRELKKTYNAINDILLQSFSEKSDKKVNYISLQDKNGYFPDFFVPEIVPDSIKLFNNNTSACKSEKDLFEKFFFDNYNIKLNLLETDDKIYPSISNLICPGCPFVNIFTKGIEPNTVVFTDIKCKGILQEFPELNFLTIDGYMGIISSDVRSATLFIGKASSYKTHYSSFISKRGRMILLNDNDVSKIEGFRYIRHPKKLDKLKNILYPYSCNNIKKYSKAKIKLSKCSCVKNNISCNVFEKTLCPAIYTSSGSVMIDSVMCNGCLACKNLCSQGAVS